MAMVNTQMKTYSYYSYGEKDGYGQEQLSTSPAGTVKMAINILSQSVQDNALYSGAQYIGLTHNKDISDKWVILYGTEKLKVQYVNPLGRMCQVFMARCS
nr:MAG TPA: hypothetical protein [Caudoviricetes sp.]